MSGAAPAAAQNPETVPPVSLSPAPGATIAFGRPVTFTVRGYPGEDLAGLWVHVSRSPDEEEACGTIDDDIDLESFDATSTPGVYTATVDADSFPRAGVYYWQAYRITYADDADGCVEGPVRSLRYGSLPPRLPGLYTGRTSQGRALSFRLDSTRTMVTFLNSSIRLSCSRGSLTTRLGFRRMTVRRNATFAQSVSSSRFTIPGRESATVTGRFTSMTRAQGTLSASASFPTRLGSCGFRRHSWTARRTGS
jgi:hypothetical protein